jgi:cytochrome c-type biogenesis protein
VLGFFRRNAPLVSRIGGAMLVIVGILEVTGVWTSVINWMRSNWMTTSYHLPL